MRRILCACVLVTAFVYSTAAHAGDADTIVQAINSQFSEICSAELKGWFSKTLKIDWTSRTSRLDAIKVLAEISTVKERLYKDGVRYLQFPNDAGGYNVIDWKTGDKTSVAERAPYYFGASTTAPPPQPRLPTEVGANSPPALQRPPTEGFRFYLVTPGTSARTHYDTLAECDLARRNSGFGVCLCQLLTARCQTPGPGPGTGVGAKSALAN